MSKPIFYYDKRSPPVRSIFLLIGALKLDVECVHIDLLKGEHVGEEFVKVRPRIANVIPQSVLLLSISRFSPDQPTTHGSRLEGWRHHSHRQPRDSYLLGGEIWR